jgi:hypothetical protein
MMSFLKSEKTHKNLIVLFFVWFILQALYFAFRILPSIAPDEEQHFRMATIMAEENWFFFKDSIKSYGWGQLNHNTYFYHFLMGLFMRLVPFEFDRFATLVSARLINVFIASVGFYYSYKLVKEITTDRWIQITALGIQSNVLMYVFISGMVNYDNLAFTLAFASFYYLVAFYKNEKFQNFIYAILATLIGCISKLTFLPLALFFVIVAFFWHKKIIRSFLKTTFHLNIKNTAIYLLCIFLFSLNCALYGVNIIKFNSIIPSCTQVLGEQICATYHAESKRDILLTEAGKLIPRVSIGHYVDRYFRSIERNTMGIGGHRELGQANFDVAFTPTRILVVLFLISLFINRHHLWGQKELLMLLLISFSYISIVMLNHANTYMKIGVFELALHGRYNFPILAPAIAIFSYFILFRLPEKYKIMASLSIIALMFKLGFYFFITNVPGEEWLR